MMENISQSLSTKIKPCIDQGAIMSTPVNTFSKSGNEILDAYSLKGDLFLENEQRQKNIVYEYYDPSTDDFLAFEGIVDYFKIDGIAFIAEKPVEIDIPVLVKHKTSFMPYNGDSLGAGKHGKVVSCEKVQNLNDNSRYRITLQFFIQ